MSKQATARARPRPATAPARAAAPAALPTPINGGVTLDFAGLLPERQVADQLAGEVRVVLGGREYVLPVLPIYYNRRWKDAMEVNLQGMLLAIEEAGDDLGAVIAAFATATPQMLDSLYAYDRAGEEEPEGPVHPPVLPERSALERRATESEVLMATLEVWSAANPFVALAHSAMRAQERELEPQETPASASPTPTSSRRPSTAGSRGRSSAS